MVRPQKEVMGLQKSAEIQADRLRLKVGTLEVDLNGVGMGTILLDGKRFPVEAMTITLLAGYLPRVHALFTPMAAGTTPHPAEEYHPEYVVNGGGRHG